MAIGFSRKGNESKLFFVGSQGEECLNEWLVTAKVVIHFPPNELGQFKH